MALAPEWPPEALSTIRLLIDLSIPRYLMGELKAPRSAYSLVEQAINKLAQAEDHLREVVLIGTNPGFNHVLFEAEALIRQAVSALTRTIPSGEKQLDPHAKLTWPKTKRGQ
jgi:hypothetical protein